MGGRAAGALTMAGQPTKPPAGQAVIAALPDPAVLTTNGWENGGAVIKE